MSTGSITAFNSVVPDSSDITASDNFINSSPDTSKQGFWSHTFSQQHVNDHVFNTSGYNSFINIASNIPFIGGAFKVANSLLQTISGNKTLGGGLAETAFNFATFGIPKSVSDALGNYERFSANNYQLNGPSRNQLQGEFQRAGLTKKDG